MTKTAPVSVKYFFLEAHSNPPRARAGALRQRLGAQRWAAKDLSVLSAF
jgi:hypothetical protein